jgi:N-methylhydantoinase A
MRVGIDTGGTFTDYVALGPSGLWVGKCPSTPQQPAEAVLSALAALAHQGLPEPLELVHGTTVATNALLEGKGAPTALITTAGFADLLAIGRQARASLYDLNLPLPPERVPAAWRLELPERVNARGQIELPLDPAALAGLSLPPEVEAVAVCLLFAYLEPAHEAQVAAALRQRGLLVSASHEVVPEYREYERFSTTVANASLLPIVQRYLDYLQQGLVRQGLADLPLRLIQSNGGSLQLQQLKAQPVQAVLSGPAAGLLGAAALARALSLPRLLTLDMGGTSTDVALYDGALPLKHEHHLGGMPLKTPLLDIHTVGAGGGSLVWIDAGGALRVGPQSAGADPGPFCYGRGQALTVTDAQLLLGRLQPALQPDTPLSRQLLQQSEMPRRLEQAFAALGQPLGLSATATALGVVSVERGHDPADFVLFCFGGAGGLHACELAEALGMSQVLVPAYAGVFSALGMLYAPARQDLSLTVLGRFSDVRAATLQPIFEALAAQARQQLCRQAGQLQSQALDPAELQLAFSADLRYLGQSFELNIPWLPDDTDGSRLTAAFHAAHKRAYAYARPDHPLELVTLRLCASGPAPEVSLPTWQPRAEALPRQVPIWLASGEQATVPVYLRDSLAVGQTLSGPALLLEATGTTWIAPQWRALVDPQGHLQLTRAAQP